MAYTLRQAVIKTGLTKSTIQRYFQDPPLNSRQPEVNKEKDRNTEWTLTDDDMEILWQIKIYQSLGLRRPDVIKILSKSTMERQKELDKAISSLEQKIEEAKVYSTTKLIGNVKAISSNEMTDVMAEIVKTVKSEYHRIEDLNIYKNQFTDLDDINSDKYLLSIASLYGKIDAIDNECQSLIKKVDDLVYKVCKEKVTRLDSIKEGIMDLDIPYENKEYLLEVTRIYFNGIKDDSNELSKITLNILGFAKNGLKTTSYEVQNEVSKIWKYYDEIGYNHIGISFLLQVFIKFFSSDEIKRKLDDGNDKGFAWFMARSIEIYLLER